MVVEAKQYCILSYKSKFQEIDQMQNLTRSEKLWTFRLAVILIVSLIYAVVFHFLYSLARHGVVAYVNLIPVFLLSWLWGIRAGLLVNLLNILVWTNLIIKSITPEASFLHIDAFLGIIVHFSFGLVCGSFSSLNRKLQYQINERKNAANQLKEYQNHLEEMVRSRTKELQKANERLSQAEKMEAIGQLAGGIAHDFNNQLTIVLGYTEILKKRIKGDPQAQEYLQQIYKSGKRASDLTKQLLAFARKGVYKMQTVDINEISKEIKTLLSRGINKNITINTVLSATLPYVWGGATQLQSAILNLALNARDAMENGGILTIETLNTKVDQQFCLDHSLKIAPGDYVCISVHDTGSGMDEEVKKHLFEPFFTTKKEGKGTGMGLAAVYGIVKSHKGAIMVESEPQKGSTFSLLFPQTSKIITNSDTDSLVTLPIRNNIHLLVIEDETEVAATIKEMLCDPIFTVTLAHDGKSGIDIYRDCWQNIDSVIIDMVMPGLDGFQTFSALKKINPDVKAIISSGFTLTQKIEDTLKSGARSFLQKPYTKNELLSQIKFVLDEKPVSSMQC